MSTLPPLFLFQTTHSVSELCETFFDKSGWSGDYTTDIEGLRSALEEVYTLALEDFSWEELESVCSESNADAVTPSALAALYPDAVVLRIRIPSASDEVVKRAQAIHRLVAHDLERPVVPRPGDCVFEEASNAQFRASLRLCGVFPPYEYYSKREVLVKAYVKAPMVLSNVAQCTHLSDQKKRMDAEICRSTIISDGSSYEFYPDCLRYGDDKPATLVETPNERVCRVAKPEKQLEASQADLRKTQAGGAGGAPSVTTPTATVSAGAGPLAGAPTPVASAAKGLVGPLGSAVPPALTPAAVPAPTPVLLPVPGAAPSVAGATLGPGSFRAPTAILLAQQARAQQARRPVCSSCTVA